MMGKKFVWICKKKSILRQSFCRSSNLILNLFTLMVNANIPDIAIEPDKSVKKVSSIDH